MRFDQQSQTAATPARHTAGSDAPVGEIQDCWNKIGVLGDLSCPELQRHIHCRNCPVFCRAAAALLDREPSADYLREWTEHFAVPKAQTAPDRLSLVVFRIGPEWFALPTNVLHEVAEFRPIHSLPHRRHGVVLGIVNIRGELLVCVSLGRLLRIDEHLLASDKTQSAISRPLHLKPHSPRARLIVAGITTAERLVFPVDEVGGIQRCQTHQLKQTPATVSKSSATFTRGILSWNDKSVGCLDPELLFPALERSLANAGNQMMK